MQAQYLAAIGSPRVGWKVGVTSEAARQMLGFDEPFSGPMFERFTQASPGRVAVSMEDLRILEPEIGFRMGEGLPPRGAEYAMQEVQAAIATVHPVFELVNKRLPGTVKDAPGWLVADGGLHHAFVYGPGFDYAPGMDLAGEAVSVFLDGKLVTEGAGANALGDPLNVVLWLANHLRTRGIGLRAGDWVSTGLLTDVVVPEPGARVRAEFATLGQVELVLE